MGRIIYFNTGGRNQRGFTLIVVIVFMTLISLAILTIMNTLETRSFGSSSANDEEAFAVAQSGLDATIKYLESSLLANNDWTKSYGNYLPEGRMSGRVGQGAFSVAFLWPEAHRVTITCTGSVGRYSRTVMRGIARVSRGGGYSIFCCGTAGFNLENSLLVKGNMYTSADCTNSSSDSSQSQPVVGRVYCRYHSHFYGSALEGVVTFPEEYGYPFMERNALNGYRKLCADFDEIWRNYPGGQVPLNGNWIPGTYRFASEQNVYYPFISASTSGVYLIDTSGNPNTVNIIVQGDVNLTGGAIIKFTAGSRVNIIARSISLDQQAAISSLDCGPIYLFTEYEFNMDGESRLEPACMRILTSVYNQSGGSDMWTRFPGSGELTLYVTSSCKIGGDYSGNQNTAANIVLDGAQIRIADNSSVTGVIYCLGESEIDIDHSARVYGTVIGGNFRKDYWLHSNSGAAILESAGRWRIPPPDIPMALGLNPVGTGGYAVWRER